MLQKISLQNVIETVLTEKGMELEEGIVRGLRRGFYRFLERVGGDKETLKDGGRTIVFDGFEVSFMKTIIRQLYDGKGLIAKFTDERSDVSSMDIRNLIQSIIDEERNAGVSDEELVHLALFLNNKFLSWQLYNIENCHLLIDTLAANMQDLPASLKALYMSKVEHILKKEFALRVVEMVLNIADVSLFIEDSKQVFGDDIGVQSYSEFEPEIRAEYIQRDKEILGKIQKDDDLRLYIENKIGKRAEEIFSYASLGDKKE